MLIAEKITDIDERFILESDPIVGVAATLRPRASALSRFLGSGVGAAVISGVVALGAVVAIVMAGRADPVIPPVSTEETTAEETSEEQKQETEEATEDESESTTEPVTEEITEPVTEDIIDTPEEAEARKDELIAILDALDYKWNILADPSYYFDQYTPVKEFGKYGVPYMLDYIMEHEGETDAEELKRLGVILHFAYHNLGITDTSDWHRPDPYSSDLFDNTTCLMKHLEEYGLKTNTKDNVTLEERIRSTTVLFTHLYNSLL